MRALAWVIAALAVATVAANAPDPIVEDEHFRSIKAHIKHKENVDNFMNGDLMMAVGSNGPKEEEARLNLWHAEQLRIDEAIDGQIQGLRDDGYSEDAIHGAVDTILHAAQAQ